MAFFSNKIQTVTSIATVENLQHPQKRATDRPPTFAGVLIFTSRLSGSTVLRISALHDGTRADNGNGYMRRARSAHASNITHRIHSVQPMVSTFPVVAKPAIFHPSQIHPRSRCPPTTFGMDGCFAHFCYNQMTNSERAVLNDRGQSSAYNFLLFSEGLAKFPTHPHFFFYCR